MRKLLVVLCLAVLLDGVTLATRCYSDYCRNTSHFNPHNGDLCLIKPVERGKECNALKFEHMGHAPPPGQSLAQVFLTAYVKDFGDLKGKATTFNFSISDVNFNSLVTRYQSLGGDESACRYVEFNTNFNQFFPMDFYVSCPFYNNSYENDQYRLEYLISAQNYEYSRKLVFIVPNHRFIDNIVKDVSLFTPFIYVDVSDMTTLTLHIQPLPKRFDVSNYKVWMLNKDDSSDIREVILEKSESNQHISYKFPVTKGTYYFKVAALHPICKEYGCINSTSPFITIKPQDSQHKLLIMIISIVWIPPVILYAIYNAYKMYKRNVLLKSQPLKKPKCLLVYSPTHISHVYVVVELAKYLRNCNIDAMIDTLDIPETTHKDPVLWCNDAFHSADVIIVVTSPRSDEIAQVVYRNMDSQALRLIKENYPQHDKRYYVVEFSYCESDDVPKEARYFKRFSMPDDLRQLVRTIYDIDYVPSYGVLSTEFENSIKWAKMVLPDAKKNLKSEIKKDYDYSKLTEETMSLKSMQIKESETKYDNSSDQGTSVPKQFRTNIEELNLLGESSNDTDTTVVNHPTSSTGFQIDTLNL